MKDFLIRLHKGLSAFLLYVVMLDLALSPLANYKSFFVIESAMADVSTATENQLKCCANMTSDFNRIRCQESVCSRDTDPSAKDECRYKASQDEIKKLIDDGDLAELNQATMLLGLAAILPLNIIIAAIVYFLKDKNACTWPSETLMSLSSLIQAGYELIEFWVSSTALKNLNEKYQALNVDQNNSNAQLMSYEYFLQKEEISKKFTGWRINAQIFSTALMLAAVLAAIAEYSDPTGALCPDGAKSKESAQYAEQVAQTEKQGDRAKKMKGVDGAEDDINTGPNKGLGDEADEFDEASDAGKGSKADDDLDLDDVDVDQQPVRGKSPESDDVQVKADPDANANASNGGQSGSSSGAGKNQPDLDPAPYKAQAQYLDARIKKLQTKQIPDVASFDDLRAHGIIQASNDDVAKMKFGDLPEGFQEAAIPAPPGKKLGDLDVSEIQFDKKQLQQMYAQKRADLDVHVDADAGGNPVANKKVGDVADVDAQAKPLTKQQGQSDVELKDGSPVTDKATDKAKKPGDARASKKTQSKTDAEVEVKELDADPSGKGSKPAKGQADPDDPVVKAQKARDETTADTRQKKADMVKQENEELGVTSARKEKAKTLQENFDQQNLAQREKAFKEAQQNAQAQKAKVQAEIQQIDAKRANLQAEKQKALTDIDAQIEVRRQKIIDQDIPDSGVKQAKLKELDAELELEKAKIDKKYKPELDLLEQKQQKKLAKIGALDEELNVKAASLEADKAKVSAGKSLPLTPAQQKQMKKMKDFQDQVDAFNADDTNRFKGAKRQRLNDGPDGLVLEREFQSPNGGTIKEEFQVDPASLGSKDGLKTSHSTTTKYDQSGKKVAVTTSTPPNADVEVRTRINYDSNGGVQEHLVSVKPKGATEPVVFSRKSFDAEITDPRIKPEADGIIAQVNKSKNATVEQLPAPKGQTQTRVSSVDADGTTRSYVVVKDQNGSRVTQVSSATPSRTGDVSEVTEVHFNTDKGKNYREQNVFEVTTSKDGPKRKLRTTETSYSDGADKVTVKTKRGPDGKNFVQDGDVIIESPPAPPPRTQAKQLPPPPPPPRPNSVPDAQAARGLDSVDTFQIVDPKHPKAQIADVVVVESATGKRVTIQSGDVPAAQTVKVNNNGIETFEIHQGPKVHVAEVVDPVTGVRMGIAPKPDMSGGATLRAVPDDSTGVIVHHGAPPQQHAGVIIKQPDSTDVIVKVDGPDVDVQFAKIHEAPPPPIPKKPSQASIKKVAPSGSRPPLPPRPVSASKSVARVDIADEVAGVHGANSVDGVPVPQRKASDVVADLDDAGGASRLQQAGDDAGDVRLRQDSAASELKDPEASVLGKVDEADPELDVSVSRKRADADDASPRQKLSRKAQIIDDEPLSDLQPPAKRTKTDETKQPQTLLDDADDLDPVSQSRSQRSVADDADATDDLDQSSVRRTDTDDTDFSYSETRSRTRSQSSFDDADDLDQPSVRKIDADDEPSQAVIRRTGTDDDISVNARNLQGSGRGTSGTDAPKESWFKKLFKKDPKKAPPPTKKTAPAPAPKKSSGRFFNFIFGLGSWNTNPKALSPIDKKRTHLINQTAFNSRANQSQRQTQAKVHSHTSSTPSRENYLSLLVSNFITNAFAIDNAIHDNRGDDDYDEFAFKNGDGMAIFGTVMTHFGAAMALFATFVSLYGSYKGTGHFIELNKKAKATAVFRGIAASGEAGLTIALTVLIQQLSSKLDGRIASLKKLICNVKYTTSNTRFIKGCEVAPPTPTAEGDCTVSAHSDKNIHSNPYQLLSPGKDNSNFDLFAFLRNSRDIKQRSPQIHKAGLKIGLKVEVENEKKQGLTINLREILSSFFNIPPALAAISEGQGFHLPPVCADAKGAFDPDCSCRAKNNCLGVTMKQFNQLPKHVSQDPTIKDLLIDANKFAQGRLTIDQLDPLKYLGSIAKLKTMIKKERETVNAQLKKQGKKKQFPPLSKALTGLFKKVNSFIRENKDNPRMKKSAGLFSHDQNQGNKNILEKKMKLFMAEGLKKQNLDDPELKDILDSEESGTTQKREISSQFIGQNGQSVTHEKVGKLQYDDLGDEVEINSIQEDSNKNIWKTISSRYIKIYYK